MNRKNILIAIGFTVLISLVLLYAVALHQTQNELGYKSRLFSLTFSIISHEFQQRGFDPIQFPQLVIGNEARFCQIYDGTWNSLTQECHGISESHCKIITGTFRHNDGICEF